MNERLLKMEQEILLLSELTGKLSYGLCKLTDFIEKKLSVPTKRALDTNSGREAEVTIKIATEDFTKEQMIRYNISATRLEDAIDKRNLNLLSEKKLSELMETLDRISDKINDHLTRRNRERKQQAMSKLLCR